MNEQVRTEYSLWLGFSEEIEGQLTALINRFSRSFDTPCFVPHITLLGSIRAEQEAVAEYVDFVGRTTRSFEVETEDIVESEAFFRCVFIKVKVHPLLIDLHHSALSRFGKSGYADNYMPHISIVYGSLDQAQRQRAVSELRQQLRLIDLRASVCRIQAVETNAKTRPSQWKVVVQRQLQPAVEENDVSA